jgi:hypothetical protein
MAEKPNYGAFTSANDYSTQLADIERRRKLAEMLQAEGMKPLGDTEMVGGWAIPKSPMEGLGKAAQQISGAYQQQKITEDERALAKESQDKLMDVMRRGAEAQAGTAATPEIQPTTSVDDEGNLMPVAAAQPARGPDYAKAMQIYMEHPATVQMAMQAQQQAISDARRRAFIASLTGDKAPGAEAMRVGATQGDIGPTQSNAARPQAQAMRGVDNDLLAAMLSGDPEIIALAKAAQEGRKPVNVRPGGTVYEPGLGPTFTAPNGANQITWQNGVPSMNNMQGALPALAGQSAAQSAGQEYGRLPYTLSTQNTEGAPTLNTNYNWINQATGKPPPAPMGMGGPVGPQAPQPEPSMPQRPPQVSPQSYGMPPPVVQPPVPGGYAGLQATQAQRDAEARNIQARERMPNGGGMLPTASVIPPNQPGGGLRLQDQGAGAEQRSYGEDRGKLEAARPQQAIAARTSLAAMERLSNVATELLNHPGLQSITGKVDQYPITDITPEARAARALQGTMVKQSAVNTLQTMRDMSKSGGAVGQVTEKEWPILEQQLSALDAAQSPQDYAIALQNLNNQIKGAMDRVKRAYAETYGMPLQYESVPYVTQGRQNADALIKGSRGNTGTPSGMTAPQRRGVVKFSDL